MDRSKDVQQAVHQPQHQPAAYEEENEQEKSAASLEAPAFQLKVNPIQKQEEDEGEEEVQTKMNPVQKQEEEELEEAQAKMNPVQKQEVEEEEMAMKKDPVQKQAEQEEEDEEAAQTKMNPVQKQEELPEEDLAQKKMNPVQKQEEEEVMPKMNPVQRNKNTQKRPYQLKSHQVKTASIGASSKLPAQLKENMESSLGGDFSNTQIYANSQKAKKMGALAYAQGNEVHFAPGKYDTESQQGKELIGHELTHVVQQKKGVVQKTKKDRGMRVNKDYKLEKEADDLGKKAANASFEDAPRTLNKSYEQHLAEQPGDNNNNKN